MSELEIYKGMVRNMKDEIKERKPLVYWTTDKVYVNGIEITDVNSWKKVIKNFKDLEEENKKLRVYLKPENIVNKIKELEHTQDLYNQLLKDYDGTQQENEDYKSRVEKAIEYIQKTKFCDNDECCILNETWFGKKILNILQGKE